MMMREKDQNFNDIPRLFFADKRMSCLKKGKILKSFLKHSTKRKKKNQKISQP
jgi:hypothetical protein